MNEAEKEGANASAKLKMRSVDVVCLTITLANYLIYHAVLVTAFYRVPHLTVLGYQSTFDSRPPASRDLREHSGCR